MVEEPPVGANCSVEFSSVFETLLGNLCYAIPFRMLPDFKMYVCFVYPSIERNAVYSAVSLSLSRFFFWVVNLITTCVEMTKT